MSKVQLIQELKDMIDELEKEIREADARLPAHSIKPHQLIAIEEMELELNQKKVQLKELLSSK